MKTFLTEKHNIPEGATHYADETDLDCFIWFREDTEEIMLEGFKFREWKRAGKSSLSDLKPIPQAKEVEWENGGECRHKDSLGNIHSGFVYLCLNPFDGRAMICKSYGEEMDVISVERGDLLEPETEAERIEREELEAAEAMGMPDIEAWFWELDSVDKKDEYRLNTKHKLAKLISEFKLSLVKAGYTKEINNG